VAGGSGWSPCPTVKVTDGGAGEIVPSGGAPAVALLAAWGVAVGASGPTVPGRGAVAEAVLIGAAVVPTRIVLLALALAVGERSPLRGEGLGVADTGGGPTAVAVGLGLTGALGVLVAGWLVGAPGARDGVSVGVLVLVGTAVREGVRVGTVWLLTGAGASSPNNQSATATPSASCCQRHAPAFMAPALSGGWRAVTGG
jgi:hypothetical protein